MDQTDAYAVLPFGLNIRNDFGGPERCDVSNLVPSNEWREGVENFDVEHEPADPKFIAEAVAAVLACTETAMRHFASVGAVALLPGEYDGALRQNLALVVRASDAERARDLAYSNCLMSPIGKLRNLVIDVSDDWMSMSLNEMTLPELFAAADDARASNHDLAEVFVDRLPRDDESIDAWVERVCISSDRLSALATAWEASGNDIQLFPSHSIILASTNEETVDWLVPGLIPRECVTLLAGPHSTGKTTVMGELIAKLCDPAHKRRTFLGESIQPKGGAHAFITAEDPPKWVRNFRIGDFLTQDAIINGFVIDGRNGRSLDDCLRALDRGNGIDLLVVDPVTDFLKDENDAGETGQFYNRLNSFAQTRRCAVVAIHHVNKNHNGKISSLRKAVRGSGVHVDRPRMVLGMEAQKGGVFAVGIVKSNIPPSEHVWSAVGEARLFQRTSDGLIELDENAGRARPTDNAELDSWVFEQIADHNARGLTVRRTGKRGLYNLARGTTLEFSRNAIEAAAARLVSGGRLIDEPDRGLVLPDTVQQ